MEDLMRTVLFAFCVAALIGAFLLMLGVVPVLFWHQFKEWREGRGRGRQPRRAAGGLGSPGGVPVRVADLVRIDGDDPSVLGGYVRFMSLPPLRDAFDDPPEYAGAVLVYDDAAWIGTGFHSFGVWYWEDGTVIHRVTSWRDMLV